MSLTPIEGKSSSSAYQMSEYCLMKNKAPKLNCTIQELAQLFITEGEKEGIRGDIAFAQSCVETGYFKYGGQVLWYQNNYCGLGALDGNAVGKNASFETPQLGVRAQIQHLKAYANKKPLNLECVDPRFKYVSRGISEYVEWLGIQENPNKKGWASGKDYGSKILYVLRGFTTITDKISTPPQVKPEPQAPVQPTISPIKKLMLFDGHIVNVDTVTVNDVQYMKLEDFSDRLDIKFNDSKGMFEVITKAKILRG